MTTAYSDVHKTVGIYETTTSHDSRTTSFRAVQTLSGMRILFGAIFLFDGILKWVLIQQGTMQGTIQGFGYDYLSNNWLAIGVLVGLGETLGGIALIAGMFQRPAAIWSAAILLSIWMFGGLGGVYSASSGWSFVGYTDPGGDLMLMLVFVVLIFAPYAYGLASHYKIRERFATNSVRDRTLRFLIT
jgi:uncharacterized membrane protein YphA (DoxX/SURF4 family)